MNLLTGQTPAWATVMIPFLAMTCFIGNSAGLYASEENQEIVVGLISDDSGNAEALIVKIHIQDRQPLLQVRNRLIGDSLSMPLEQSLFQHLDRDRDANITHDEYQEAEHLLKNLDHDDDEQLAPLEVSPRLLSESTEHPTNPQQQPSIYVAHNSETLTALKSALTQRGLNADQAIESAEAIFDFSIEQGRLIQSKASSTSSDQSVVMTQTPTGWLIRKNGLSIDLFSPEVNVSMPMRSSQAEPQSLQFQTRPGRRGWFELLDRNGDSMLSRAELRAAPALSKAHQSTLAAASFSLAISSALEHVSPGIRLVKSVQEVDFNEIPSQIRWFTAMDANRDGVVSRQEFLGSTADFAKFDGDHDQLITRDEVKLANNQEKGHLSTDPRRESE